MIRHIHLHMDFCLFNQRPESVALVIYVFRKTLTHCRLGDTIMAK